MTKTYSHKVVNLKDAYGKTYRTVSTVREDWDTGFSVVTLDGKFSKREAIDRAKKLFSNPML